MTTVTEARARLGEHVSIAGVPWPVYKLAALAAGLLILLVFVAAGATPATAVLSGAAAATAIWLTGAALGADRR
ncbi:hypothetical protein ABQE69_12150 [Mycolicibacillus trivialis]|uniref:Uncharacterized protein n=1 Tax=Mycolicibacillus trivialis TaxID=1798 RepID=A0A1X2EPI6_9MYCO|nr:hypothetical protein [Mycolicibacillus trivialis]ORX08043.1 hypothetical protein AWC30_03795 [Mycolicibacillus trivialis]